MGHAAASIVVSARESTVLFRGRIYGFSTCRVTRCPDKVTFGVEESTIGRIYVRTTAMWPNSKWSE